MPATEAKSLEELSERHHRSRETRSLDCSGVMTITKLAGDYELGALLLVRTTTRFRNPTPL